jgi:heme exporter protein D
MAEFFAMGGYAAYIWPAYAVAAIVLLALLVVTLRTLRVREAVHRTLEESRPRRRKNARGNGVAARPAVEGHEG